MITIKPVSPTYRIPANVVGEELDGEMVLLNLETGIYFGLNPVGTQVWRELGDHGDLRTAVASICQRYSNVSEQTIQEDVLALVTELTSRGLLTRDSMAEFGC